MLLLSWLLLPTARGNAIAGAATRHRLCTTTVSFLGVRVKALRAAAECPRTPRTHHRVHCYLVGEPARAAAAGRHGGDDQRGERSACVVLGPREGSRSAGERRCSWSNVVHGAGEPQMCSRSPRSSNLAAVRAQDRAAGNAEGAAKAVLKILAARRIVVGDAERMRILGESDMVEFDRWLVEAMTCTDVAELFTTASQG